MALVGSFPFNSFLSGVLSCIGTAVLAGKFSISYNKYLYGYTLRMYESNILLYSVFIVCLRIQVNKENKEFKVMLCRF